MKIYIASDIHGSAKYCRLLVEQFKKGRGEKLLLLGDILYHGPRNPLPEEYNPAEVARMLSEIKSSIICVRGNCDSEVDQMVLPFPIMNDYAAVYADGLALYLSHGHRETPPLKEGDIYLTGHTHVPLDVLEEGGWRHLNPGSVALPKESSAHSYIVLDGNEFTFEKL